MKVKAIFSVILLLFYLTSSWMFQDKKACQLFSKNLDIIKQRVDGKKKQHLEDVNEAINFLEELTGIPSHSNGNYFGRFDPTEEDYTAWSYWFKLNGSRIYWDEKTQKVLKKPTG